MRRLDRLAPLSIVRALRGTGKTTLLAHWALAQQDDGAHVVWLDAAASHTSPETFSSRFLDALAHARLLAPPSDPLEPDPRSGSGSPAGWVEEVVASLALIDQRVVVIIDDAHHATDPAVVGQLCELLRRAPTLHLALSTRVYHPLEDVARGHGLNVAVLTGRDLTISADELPAFAETWGHQITADRADQLHTGVRPPPRVRLESPQSSTTMRLPVSA